MKKRLLTLMLTATMILGMGAMASAEDVKYEESEETSLTIQKTYTSTEDFIPGETLSFTVTPGKENPDTPVITVGTNNTFTVAGKTNEITVNVPSYDTAGTYKYTIKEVAGNTAGVTYDTATTIEVAVLVGYDNENNKLVILNKGYTLKNENGEKIETFVNIFETGDFTVGKDVDGNMANENDKFEITVTLTSTKPVLTSIKVGGVEVKANQWSEANGVYTYTDKREYSESQGTITFANIPVGVNVSVEETEKDMQGYTKVSITDGTKDANDMSSFSIDDTTEDTVVVKNIKNDSIETGINLDNIPYIILLAVVILGAVVVIRRRRYTAM